MSAKIREQLISFQGRNLVWRLADLAAVSVANEIFVYREYRSAEEIIKQATHPILDVGAHVGLFSAYAACLNPRVKIYSLEPDRDNFELMRQNVREHDFHNVKLIAGALSKFGGPQDLFLSPDSHNHTLLAPSGVERAKKEVVKTWTLSGLLNEYSLDRLSLVKMDIEGSEFALFDDESKSAWVLVEAIIMEVHEEFGSGRDLEERLRSFGFSVQRFSSGFDKTMSFFLARNKKI